MDFLRNLSNFLDKNRFLYYVVYRSIQRRIEDEGVREVWRLFLSHMTKASKNFDAFFINHHKKGGEEE